MAKMRSRTEALVNAYLNNYQNANATTVSGGQSAQRSAQSKGGAIMNATDKTLPTLKDYSADVMNGIVKSAENAQSTAISNLKLAQKQMEEEQKAAEKAAKSATRSSGKSSSKKSSSKSSNSDSDLSTAAAAALADDGSNATSNTTTTIKNSSKTDTKKSKQKSAAQQLVEKKIAAANAGENKGKAVGKTYAEQKDAGNTAAKPAQSRAAGKAGNVIGSTYGALGQAPSASEKDAAKAKRTDWQSQQEDTAAALKKLQTDADYRAELAQPGRKLTSAEVKAVNQYEKSTKNTGFSGLKRVLDLAQNSDNLSEEEYAQKAAELNAELNQNSALSSKAQGNGAGQSAQAFTAGIYDSVPFLSQASNKLAETANSIYPDGQQLPTLSDTLDATKSYDPLAAGAGTMVGKGMQYNLFNTAMAGTPLAEAMGKVGGKVASAASKIPVLGQFATPAAGEALGRILTDQAADTALDTLPSLVNDLQTYDNQQGRIKNGEQVDNVMTPGQIGLNVLGNVGQNFLFNAIPEVGGAVVNRLKGAAGDAAQDALKQADNAVQNAQGEVSLATDDAKLSLQNSDTLPIDAQDTVAYNGVNGGVVNDNLGAGVRADVSVNTDAGGSYEPQPGGNRSGIVGQTGEAGLSSSARGNRRGVQSADAENVAQVAEWAKSITGKGRQSVYTRRIENLYNQMQNGASRESLAEEAANIAAGIVKESDFAEPLDEATTVLRQYIKDTPIRLDEKAAGDILYTSGLKNIQQYNFQNGTKFSLTDGVPYDTAMQELSEMGVGVNGSSVDDLLKAVESSNAKPLVDSDQAAAVADYYRDFILDGQTGGQPSAEDFADWLDVQSFDRDAPDYVQRLLKRDNIPTLNQTAETVSDSLPETELPLNGSDSLPAHSVGANETQYNRAEVLNQDYANQRDMTSGLDDTHRENLQTENTHQVWTDAEAKKQAEDDISTYIQQAGGDESKALDNAMQDLRNKEHWNKGDSATADEIRDRLKTQYAATEPGTPEYYTQKARYEAWNQKRSQVRSETAQTMQSFHGDAGERVDAVSKPITERWVKNNPAQDEKLKSLSDELAKLKDELHERDIADMEREAMQGVFENGGSAAKRTAGNMDAEFDQMLRDTGVPTHEERIANFSDVDKAKYKTATDDAYNKIVSRVKKLCEQNNVQIDDNGAKTIAGKIMNGDNAESYYNSLIMQAAGISDLSIDEMQMVDDLYSKAATLPDSKERYDMEQMAVGIMAKHLPAADAFEKIDNLRFLAMLGNTTTHARNILGNIGNMATTTAENEISALMQMTLPKEARTKAIYTPTNMKNAAEDYIMNQRYSDLIGRTGKSDLTSALQSERKIYGDSLGGKFLQKLTDWNSGLLAKEDDIFVKRGMVNSLASNLTAKGLDESIFTATDVQSKQILDDAVAQAVRDAAEVTYHIDNAATEMLSKFSHMGDKRGGIGQKIGYCITNGLLPFAKTTANITKTALTLNPIGATVEGIYRAGTHKGAAAVMDSAAKGIIGTGMIAFGKWAAEQGYLTGSLDADTKDYDEMTGQQEYSLNIPGVGSYTLDWLAPMAVPVMIGANLKDMSADDVVNTLLTDPGKFAGQIGDIMLKSIDPISNMSIVQSFNNALDNLKYAGDNGMGAAGTLLANAGTSYLQQFYPTMFGKVARTIDDTRRSSYGGGDSYTERNNNYLKKSTLNKVPFLSKNNEPYIDQWGREEASLDNTDDSAGGTALRGLYNLASPGYYSAENVTPVDEYLQGLYGSTNDSKVYPEKASSKITVDSENYYMTPEEKTEYAKTSGQTAYDIIDSLRQNDLFLKLPEDQQSELVQKAYSVAKTVGGVAAVGDGVSGTNSKEYQAYQQGGVPTLENYLLTKNAIDVASDGSEENLKKSDKTKILLNQGLDSESIYSNYMLLYPSDEKVPTIYNQYGADGVKDWLRYINTADLDGNGSVSQAEAQATLDQMNLTDQLKAAYWQMTNKTWKSKNNPY